MQQPFLQEFRMQRKLSCLVSFAHHQQGEQQFPVDKNM